MRRSLVLTDESARHPFRASLPPHVLKFDEDGEPANRSQWIVTAADVRGFATAYTACLIATLAFIF